MPAGRPERRISGSPTTSAETQPAAAAGASDGTSPTCEWRMTGKRPGTVKAFVFGSIEMSPARYAPAATKLTCPNEITPELPTNTHSATTTLTITSAFVNSSWCAFESDCAIAAVATTRRTGAASCAAGTSARLMDGPSYALHLPGAQRREKARGSQQQDGDDDSVHGRGEVDAARRGQEVSEQSVDDADREAAERRAPQPVEAADDDADEREDRDRHAHAGGDERVRDGVQHADRRREHAGDDE